MTNGASDGRNTAFSAWTTSCHVETTTTCYCQLPQVAFPFTATHSCTVAATQSCSLPELRNQEGTSDKHCRTNTDPNFVGTWSAFDSRVSAQISTIHAYTWAMSFSSKASYSRRSFGRKGGRDFTAAAMAIWDDEITAQTGVDTSQVGDLVRSFDNDVRAPVKATKSVTVTAHCANCMMQMVGFEVG